MEEKLYSPLNFYLRDNESVDQGVYDEIQYWRDELTHEEAYTNMAEIEAFLADDRKTYDAQRGLMEYYGAGPLNDKVQSLFPHVELHGDQLWMVADLQLAEPLTPLEMAELKSWWGGQLSDGWGEGLEQREIAVGEGTLYIEPWTSSAGFFIATQAEFDQRMGIEREGAALPEPEILSSLADQRRELLLRVNLNLSDYCEGLLGTDENELIGMAEEIATRFGVRHYLEKIHTFRTPELEFLLRQDDPLAVVAMHTPPIHTLLDMTGAIADLSAIGDAINDPKRQPGRSAAMEVVAQAEQNKAGRDALFTLIAQKHCHVETLEERKRDSLDFHEVSVWGLKAALEEAFMAGVAHQREQMSIVAAPEPRAGAVDEQALRDELNGRLEQDFAEMMNDLRSDISGALLPTQEVVTLAERITSVSATYAYLTENTLPLEQVEYLLNFRAPLEVVADRWSPALDMDSVMWDICDKQDALQGDYPLVEDAPTAPEETQDGPSPRELLAQRAAEHRGSMLAALVRLMENPGLSQEELSALEKKAVCVNECCDHLVSGSIMENHTEFLLEFENPVDVLAGRMYHNKDLVVAVSSLIWDAYEERELAQEVGLCIPALPEPAPSTAPTGKRSLLADVRKSQERIAENDRKNERRDHPADISEPEL